MSFTYEGDIETVNQWLPFAESQLLRMKQLGSSGWNIKPNADVLIMIRTQPDHIHIVATSGFDIYVFYGNTLKVTDQDQRGFYLYVSFDDAENPVVSTNKFINADGTFSYFDTEFGLIGSQAAFNPVEFYKLWRNNGANLLLAGTSTDGALKMANNLAYNSDTQRIYVSSTHNNIVKPNETKRSFYPSDKYILSLAKQGSWYVAVTYNGEIITYNGDIDAETGRLIITDSYLIEKNPHWYTGQPLGAGFTSSPDVIPYRDWNFNRDGTKLCGLVRWFDRYITTETFVHPVHNAGFIEYGLTIDQELGLLTVNIIQQAQKPRWVQANYNAETEENELVYAWLRITGDIKYYDSNDIDIPQGIGINQVAPKTPQEWLNDASNNHALGYDNAVQNLRTDLIIESESHGKMMTVRLYATNDDALGITEPVDYEAAINFSSDRFYSMIIDLDVRYRAVLVTHFDRNDKQSYVFTAFGHPVQTRYSGAPPVSFPPTFSSITESQLSHTVSEFDAEANNTARIRGDLGIYYKYYERAMFNSFYFQNYKLFSLEGKEEKSGIIKCHPDINKKMFSVYNSPMGFSMTNEPTETFPYIDEFWNTTKDSQGVETHEKLKAYNDIFLAEGEVQVNEPVLVDLSHKLLYEKTFKGVQEPMPVNVGYSVDHDSFYDSVDGNKSSNFQSFVMNAVWATNKQLNIKYDDAAYAASIDSNLEI